MEEAMTTRDYFDNCVYCTFQKLLYGPFLEVKFANKKGQVLMSVGGNRIPYFFSNKTEFFPFNTMPKSRFIL